MKKRYTFLDMEEVINRSWVTVSDLMVLFSTNESYARKAMRDILAEMDANGEPHFSTRPLTVPLSKVVEKYNIDTDHIRAEARKMKQ